MYMILNHRKRIRKIKKNWRGEIGKRRGWATCLRNEERSRIKVNKAAIKVGISVKRVEKIRIMEIVKYGIRIY